jgi:hypothetical protein
MKLGVITPRGDFATPRRGMSIGALGIHVDRERGERGAGVGRSGWGWGLGRGVGSALE